ncbi:hypothetical protein HPB52_011413 [Rhipicephalus sanguineus]|uniref:Nlr family card domain protein n=1 Tax=Rhipicephalus sanguineus TaxID=34632 RepID=A0A9D4PIG5_RHISA|nr:hypothetical protein HPB52_011413 [Rhipicephalus sanguineus]
MPKRKRVTTDQEDGSRRKPSSLTSDSDLEKSFFSGSSINFRTPCTSSECRPCDIFRDITIWNEFFWQVGLELRELYPGKLSLVKMDGPCGPLDARRCKHEAATLLHRLLTYHHCFVSLVLNHWIFVDHHQLICDALPKSPSLRKLEVHLFTINERAFQSFTAVLPFLNHLQELNCQMMDLERGFCEGVSELLVSTTSLTTLKLKARQMEAEYGEVIFHGLKRNTTVTTLSLHMRMDAFLSQRGVAFTDCLCDNQTLRSLIVTSYYKNDDCVPNLIIRSLFSNTTISEVRLIGFSLDNENSLLVAEMLSENRSLREFHMVDCGLYRSSRIPEYHGVSDRICPWIVALDENTTLERLTMELSCFNLEECRSLFKALASHKSLKSITVDRLIPTAEVEICRALRETGLLERFFLARPHVVKDPVVTLRECKELSSIRINPMTLHGFDSVRTALGLLPSCSHVTSVTLEVWQKWLNGDAIFLMAQYIKGTTVLRDLEMTLFSTTSNIVDRDERALMEALSFNNSVRKLSLTGLCFDDTEIQMLVDKLQASRTLYELCFYLNGFMSTTLLIQKLSPKVSSNYTLLGMEFDRRAARRDDLFAVDNVVRRNLSLVTRAAHFVIGTRHRYCAAAAELVHWNPGLVAKVQALASIDENEAVSRIENSLKSFSELDDFMCVAGVVKYGVTCHTRDDGQLQLIDLNRDCWLYIRQYLKMGDILDAQ